MSVRTKVTSREVGLSIFRATDVDETAVHVVKDSEANLYGYVLVNPNGADFFVKFYDVNGGATIGTDNPVLTVQVPANDSVIVGVTKLPQLHFSNRLEVAVTGGSADSDTTAITTDGIVQLQYA